jgi:hypothetical protein
MQKSNSKKQGVKRKVKKTVRVKEDRELVAIKREHHSELALRKHFVEAIMYPDLTGPIRIPRSGGSDRTVLGIDHSYLTMGSTSFFHLSMMGLNRTHARVFYTAASDTSNFTLTSNDVPGTTFPNDSSIDEVNLTSASMVITYTGAPFSAYGYVIVGLVPSVGAINIATSTPNTLAYYPGSLRIPVASIINNPIRIPLTKLSPTAFQFLRPADNLVDSMIPFCVSSLMDSNFVITCDITRNWECLSTVASSLAIPYDVASSSHSADCRAYEDAATEVGKMNSPETSYFSGMKTVGMRTIQALGESLPDMVGGFAKANAPMIGGFLLNGALRSVSNSGRQLHRMRIG